MIGRNEVDIITYKTSFSSFIRGIQGICTNLITTSKLKELFAGAEMHIGVAGSGKTTMIKDRLQVGD